MLSVGTIRGLAALLLFFSFFFFSVLFFLFFPSFLWVSEVNETTDTHTRTHTYTPSSSESFPSCLFLSSFLSSSPLLFPVVSSDGLYNYLSSLTSYTPSSRSLTNAPVPSLPDFFPLFPFPRRVAGPVPRLSCLAFLLPHTPLIPSVAHVEWSILAFLASSFASLPVALVITPPPTLTCRP